MYFFSFFDLKEEFHKHIKNQNSKENCDLIDLKESTNIEVEFMLKGFFFLKQSKLVLLKAKVVSKIVVTFINF